MVEHGGSSAGSYLTDPTSPIPSHCASTVATSTLRVKLTLERGYSARHTEMSGWCFLPITLVIIIAAAIIKLDQNLKGLAP